MFRHCSSKTFSFIVPAMLSDRSRTSDMNDFDSEMFSRGNESSVSVRLCGDCNIHDPTPIKFATPPRASARALLQFQ
jgi:hypothetical protein